jgi:hypothetical protein
MPVWWTLLSMEQVLKLLREDRAKLRASCVKVPTFMCAKDALKGQMPHKLLSLPMKKKHLKKVLKELRKE